MAEKKKESSSKKTAKKGTGKKPPAKKTTAGKKASKKGSASKAVSPHVKELTGLAKKLGDEDLRFLIGQAETLLYNREMEAESERMREREKQARGKISRPAYDDSVEIVEGPEGDHFIIVMRNERNFFDRDEMKKIVKLCHAAENEADAGERLFSWFSRLRQDVVRNSDLSGPADTILGNLYRSIIKTYTVKD
jgi:hypothetical protein